ETNTLFLHDALPICQQSKNPVNALAFFHRNFKTIVGNFPADVTWQSKVIGNAAVQVNNKGFGTELTEQFADTGGLNNLTLIDDGDIAAQLFRFFQIMGG